MSDLFHLHIPKTAGGSILSMLRVEYGQRLLAIPARDWEDVTPDDVAGHDVVSGHFPYSALDTWGVHDGEVFAFMRDPVERVASLYAYIHMRGRRHPGYQHVSGVSPQEFAEHGPFDNCQTRMLSGRLDFQWFHEKSPVKEGDFTTALENAGGLWFLGDVSNFTSDVQLLGEMLGWPPMIIPHVNASKSKPKIKVTPEFIERWEFDLDLYASLF